MSVFKIVEIVAPGGKQPPSGRTEVFEWDVEHRNIPTGSWNEGGQLRTNRVDYPASNRVTEQVLGSNMTDLTFSGRWQNKWNRRQGSDFEDGVGTYAEDEKARFRAMCRRGNLVEITFEGQAVRGLITSWNFDYRRRFDIDYEFTVSPHIDPTENPANISSSVDEVDDVPERMAQKALEDLNDVLRKQQESGFPQTQGTSEDTDISREEAIRSTYNDQIFAGTVTGNEEFVGNAFGVQNHFRAVPVDIIKGAADAMDSVTRNILQFGQVIDQQVLSVQTETELGLSSAITRADLIIQRAYNLTQIGNSLKSSKDLLYRAPLSDLSFDIWNKDRASYGRGTVVDTHKARKGLLKRQKTEALAFYRPVKGESLYHISTKFYKTPNNWRVIFERNNLDSLNMTGEELLVIPSI